MFPIGPSKFLSIRHWLNNEYKVCEMVLAGGSGPLQDMDV